MKPEHRLALKLTAEEWWQAVGPTLIGILMWICFMASVWLLICHPAIFFILFGIVVFVGLCFSVYYTYKLNLIKARKEMGIEKDDYT